MELQAMLLEAAGYRAPMRAPTSAASQRPPRPQQLGVGDRRLPPRPLPPPSRGETRTGGVGVGKADEVQRGTCDTRPGSAVALVDADVDAAAVAAGDTASAVARADSDKEKGGAELGGKRRLDLAEEKGGGDAGRKRGLGLAAYPPPKPRLVSATRRFPPGCGRDAAGDDDSRLVVASASDSLKKTALPLSMESSAVAISAPIAVNGHHGRDAELQRSSEPLCKSSVPSVDGLLDTDSQSHVGSAGLARKELVPATRRLLPKPRMVSAVRRFPPGCGRPRASLVAGGSSTEVTLPLLEKVVATDCSTSAAVVAKDTKVVVKAAGGSSKCLRTDREAAATSMNSFGPKKKLHVKQKSMLPLPSNVIKSAGSSSKCLRTDGEATATSMNSFGPKKKKLHVKQKSMLPSNVEDDIMKALAAYEEKYGACNVDARSKVKMMRGRFEFIRRDIIRAVKHQSLKLPRVDLAAAELIKKMPGFTQHGPIVGNVHGVEVGDEFLYRVELNIVGLHRPYQGGIDTTRDKDNMLVAISVVASGGYPDQLSRSGELIYTGSGGKISGKKGEGDQKLVRGNLALKNCIRTKTPVRVIHGFKSREETPMFTYDGLYNVVECWREGQPGSKVFKYKLLRIPGQAELQLR